MESTKGHVSALLTNIRVRLKNTGNDERKMQLFSATVKRFTVLVPGDKKNTVSLTFSACFTTLKWLLSQSL